MSAPAAWRLFYMGLIRLVCFRGYIITFGLSILIGMSTGMAGATISLPIIAAVGFVAGKAIFSDNVVFRRRM
jgi:hypothetical protein